MCPICFLNRTQNLRQSDGLHFISDSLEFGRVDVFLTTDAKLIRACQHTVLRMRVMNPVSYLAEMMEDDGC